MSDAIEPTGIESRLDSVDLIRDRLINALLEEPITELVKDTKAMLTLTTILRDRDSTNSKRLRITADKDIAKSKGEEAREIMQAVMDMRNKRKQEREANPASQEEHEAKRDISKVPLPNVEITEELTKVGVADLSYDKFIKEFEETRGISGRT